MPLRRSEPGMIISGVVHLAALIGALVVFSHTKPFDPAEEAIAVEIISDNQFNQITKGERTAKEVLPTPKPRADKVAETTKDNTPGEEKKDVASPPQRPADMKVADKPEEASTPPPPLRPQISDIKPDPKPEKKPDTDPRQLAKLMEQAELEAKEKEDKEKKEKAEAKAKQEAQEKLKKEEAVKKAEAAAKAKARAEAEAKAKREAELANKFNAGDITKLLQSKEASQSTGATAREVQKTASLGTSAGTAAKLNPSMRGQLIGMLQEQMTKCYSPPLAASGGATTLPVLDIRLNTDGSLSTEPRLIRAGSGSSERAVADAALRAVRRCAPYRIPAAFAPYFNDWKILNVEFEIPSL